MRVKNLAQAMDPVTDFGYKNLLVSGCSFTANKNEHHLISWPYYLRDLGSFERVIDCSCPGAGNTHIHNAVIHELESSPDITPENTLVIVMWSGYDRDDFLVDPIVLKRKYTDSYYYTRDCALGMTGGLAGESNLLASVENIKKIKSAESRALENYILVTSLQGYLKSRGFKFLFTEAFTPGTVLYPEYDIIDYLSPDLSAKYVEMTRELTPTLGSWSIPYLELSADGCHPDPSVHLLWTEKILIPHLQKVLNV